MNTNHKERSHRLSRTITILALFGAWLLAQGCASSKKVERPPTRETARGTPEPKATQETRGAQEIRYGETLDPMTLKAPDFSIPRKKEAEAAEPQTWMMPPDSAAHDTSWVTVPGFQLQLLQTEDGQQARESVKLAILDLDTDVEIVYDAPYYKVRAGRFLNRFDAERLQSLADEKGYSNSWVVRTPIRVRAYELTNGY